MIGRAGRLALGIAAGGAFIWNLTEFTYLTDSEFALSTFWFAFAVAWWFFSDLVVVGFGRHWGRRPQIAVFPVALALVVIDWVAYGHLWDVPLAMGVYLFTQFVFGYFSISFLLAALFAEPG
jgi:hypothetical protein